LPAPQHLFTFAAMKGFRDLRIVFMGTPEFAVASLSALVAAGCNIVGVVTAADKLAGRGMQLQQSAVKQFAVEHGLPVLQPEKLKNPDFLAALKALDADLQVVVAFRMLPEAVWDMPPMGTVNLHGSLLPQYRGAAPINWAVINGEIHTGVTTFKLQHAIDTGNILLTETIAIPPDMTAGELHDQMKGVGAALLVKTVQGLAAGSLTEVPQAQLAGGQTLCHAPKLFTDTCRIDWGQPAASIHNLIRGLSPFPAAFAQLHGKTLKLFKAAVQQEKPAIPAGQYQTDGKTYLRFACADGYINVLELQLEGKKRMAIGDFLRGYRMGS
jgi:methionyl-tRNA formyltransferase